MARVPLDPWERARRMARRAALHGHVNAVSGVDRLCDGLMATARGRRAPRAARGPLTEARALTRAGYLTGEDSSARVARLVREACEIIGGENAERG